MHRRSILAAGVSLLLSASLLPAAPGSAGARDGSAADTTEVVEVTADAPPPVRLAFFDKKMMRIPRDTVEAYRDLLDDLGMTCQYSPEQMASMATSAVRTLERHSTKTLRTRDLLARLSDNLSPSLSSDTDCVTVVTSILRSVGGDGVADAFAPTESPGGTALSRWEI